MKLLSVLAGILILVSSAAISLEVSSEKNLDTRYCQALLCSESLLVEKAYDRLGEGKTDGSGGAIALFQQALQADVASPYRWCDLAEVMAETGQTGKAREMFSEALKLGPNAPPVLLRAANFYFRMKEPEAAIERTSSILRLIADYDEIIFSMYSRMGVPVGTVLRSGIPETGRAASAYVRYLIDWKKLSDAKVAWEWTVRHSFADDVLCSEYTSLLARSGEYEEAAQVWRKQVGARDPAYLRSNLLYNSGFELEPLPSIFDWSIQKVEGVEVARDDAVVHSGKRSLRIRFLGEQNVDYHHVFQRAVVRKPGRYRLRAFIKTEDISTDQGIRLRVSNAETAMLTGSNDWKQVEVDFVVSQPMRAVDVTLLRRDSQKFDNKIKGTVWIDDVRLEPF